jgi:hypothetical protein
MYQNRATLIGFLGKDAEVKTTRNNASFTVLSLATKRSWNDRGAWPRATRSRDTVCAQWQFLRAPRRRATAAAGSRCPAGPGVWRSCHTVSIVLAESNLGAFHCQCGQPNCGAWLRTRFTLLSAAPPGACRMSPSCSRRPCWVGTD